MNWGSRLLLLLALLGFAYLVPLQAMTIVHAVEETYGKMDNRHLAIPLQGIYYGYYMPDLNAQPEDPVIKLIPEEHPSLAMYYQDWTNTSDFNTNFLKRIAAQGAIPVITWEPWNSSKDPLTQPEFAPKVIASGKYDTYIHSFAKEAAEYHRPFILRFAHEMNGNWYPWGAVNNNTPEDYIAMWRHVHDIFVSEGATNVIWAWTPNNTDGQGNTDSVMEYYPGDQYVDWTGFSAFNWGTATQGTTWKSFREIAEPIYSKLEFINKPIMVAELSSTNAGGIKEQWFDDTLMSGLPFFPNIKAVIFYNENFGKIEFALPVGMNGQTVVRRDILNNTYFIQQPILTNDPND